MMSMNMEALGENKREGLGRKVVPRVNLLVFLLVSIFLLLSSLYTAEASFFRKARSSVLDAAAPVLSVLSVPINAVNNMFGGVGDYFNVMSQNEALREENAELRQWMEEALALREIISVYEKLQTYQTPPDVLPIDAHVIGDSNDAFAKSMVVNAGSSRGIKPGFAVVNETGLVGRVIEAGSRASRVLLLTDIQSRIPVYIEGVDFEGILVGRTRLRPIIRFTNEVNEAPIPAGAKILTSGAGGVIPRGLPVGTVLSNTGEEIEVDLYTNYSQTRLVRVLEFAFPVVDDAATGDELDIGLPNPATSDPAGPVSEEMTEGAATNGGAR